jgi:hypothetical protein
MTTKDDLSDGEDGGNAKIDQLIDQGRIGEELEEFGRGMVIG